MEKLCIILGAGASNDVWNGSSPINRQDFKPPLAKDLFDLNANKAYWEVLQRYGGARVIADLLTSHLGIGDYNIEKELTHYAQHRDRRLREAYRQVPPYLRDLLFRCSTTYTDEPGCYVELLSEFLAEHPHEVLFFVLNYDDLLEKAITSFDTTMGFEQIGDYVANGRQAKVVKLHGSINWFTTFPTHQTKDWDALSRELDISSKPAEEEIVVDNTVVIVKEKQRKSRRNGDRWLYPLLTAPLAGKAVADIVCPESHINTAREFLGSCEKFLVVGTSGLDEDLLSLLENSVPPSTQARVQLVGAGNGAQEALQRFQKVVRAFKGPREASLVFDNGFRQYLSNGDASSFAQREL